MQNIRHTPKKMTEKDSKMWKKRMLSERWFSRRNVHHHQGQNKSGLESKLTDEEQQQKNKIKSDVLHCCGSQLNYRKLITLSIALEILLFNYAFFLSQLFVLFFLYLLLNLLSFHFYFQSMFEKKTTRMIFNWFLSLQVLVMKSWQITAKIKIIRNAS